ncbi:hypothetical protein GH714_042259 [Hevea brasiliensis]|uniref:GHMP kinase C-terminal domain-containing protein n=1 Tax=Hevea brasiliensis TaxID=3981 RepID=A0A6A6MWV8_HEVBR|nr:hypothetical protein GH714_042259 [Hevea brasiliensis]
MPHHVWNCSQAGALAASVLQGDLVGQGKALSSDKIVEPKRAPLIPGMEGLKKAAIGAGAFGCTISGAGPTAVAFEFPYGSFHSRFSLSSNIDSDEDEPAQYLCLILGIM